MYHVAIIGAGNLGSRHLQALALTKIPLCVEVVDSAEESLAIAKKRWEEMPENPLIEDIVFGADLGVLSPELDVVIVATSSAPRRAIVETLLTIRKVKYLILEKVLFQRLKDYDEIQALLDRRGGKAWINCGRRSLKFYRSLAEMMRQNSRVDMTVSGANWGLGCNSIHMLDIYAVLSGQNQFGVDVSSLDQGWIESKRNGYIEFTGTLRVQSAKGILNLQSDLLGERPIVITIQTERYFCMIYEMGKVAKMFRKAEKDWLWETVPVDIRNQSEVTHELVQSLIETGNCLLTPYAESASLHKVLLKGFLEHVNQFSDNKTEVCAIT